MTTRKDGLFLSIRDIICVSAYRNDLSGMVKNVLRFLPQLYKVIKYSNTWEEGFNVPYTTVRIKDIVADLVSTNYLRRERSYTVS